MKKTDLSVCHFFQEYERAVLFRLGRVRRNGTVGPGMFFIVPCLDQVHFSKFQFCTLTDLNPGFGGPC